MSQDEEPSLPQPEWHSLCLSSITNKSSGLSQHFGQESWLYIIASGTCISYLLAYNTFTAKRSSSEKQMLMIWWFLWVRNFAWLGWRPLGLIVSHESVSICFWPWHHHLKTPLGEHLLASLRRSASRLTHIFSPQGCLVTQQLASLRERDSSQDESHSL